MTDGATLPPLVGDAGAVADARTPRRLRKRPEFLAAAKGRRFHTERMTAQSRLRAADEVRDGAPAVGLYVGLTVTKRVGHAPERNRIRRRLRRAVEAALAAAPAAPADVVLIARRPALDAPFETLIDDVSRALRTLARPARSRATARPSAAPGDTGRPSAHIIPPNDTGDGMRPEPLQTKAPRGTNDG